MNIKYLVVHCSDSPQGRGDNAAIIHRWHTEKKWSGIGYHAVILEDGTIERGRPDYWSGAHVKGHNRESLGVCLIGIDEFTQAQMDSLKVMIDYWIRDYPDAEVLGHRDLNPGKPCPNFDVKAWWSEQ